MKFHPISEVFPMLNETELLELAEDIKANGLREPIWLYDKQVLDGRNRFLACQRAKIKPRFRNYDGPDPIGFVVSLNIHRRHLSDAQKGYAAAKIANLRKGQKKADAPTGASALTQSEAAKAVGTSRRNVQRASKLLENGSPELNAAVERGEVSMAKAASVVDLPKSEQLAAATAPAPEPEFKIEDFEADEEQALAAAEKERAEVIDKVMSSDDRLQTYKEEVERLTGLLAVMTQSRDHYQRQAGEAVRQLKAAQRKLARLEKKQIAEVQERAPGVQ